MATKVEMDPLQKKIAYSCLPRTQAKAWVSSQNHFLVHKGPEWVAARGKALWTAANLHRSGAHGKVSEVLRSARIAHDSSGWPLGAEGAIVRAYSEARRPSHVRRLAAVLRGYTSVRLPAPSKQQVDKARCSINSSGTDVPVEAMPRHQRGETPSDYESRVPRRRVYTHLPGPEFGRWRTIRPDSIVRPELYRLSGTSRYPASVPCPAACREAPFAHLVLSLLTRGEVPESLRACYSHDPFPTYDRYGRKVLHPDIPLREEAEVAQKQAGDPYLGKIVVLQEAGAKGRVICSPNAWVQYYLYPLHQALSGYIRRAEKEGLSDGISCMFDQVRGVNHAYDQLQKGRFVAAVDLSSATDRFPLELQQRTLEELGLSQFAQAFSDLRGPYQGPDGEDWWYRTGQAMGLYGSFPLFHLTHWSLLQGLSYRLRLDQRLPGRDPLYAVLGDDVLIFNDELLNEYLSVLEEFAVPISWHKCYKGDNTEFAGFMISRKGDQVTAFRPFKHHEGGFAPALPVCHAVGSRVKAWSPWWGRAYEAYQATLGKRDLALEPLVSTSEDLSGKAAYPGAAYLSSLVTMLRWTTQVPPGPLQVWEDCSLGLLKAEESVSDIGHAGVKTGDGFNPDTYRSDERDRKARDRMYRRHFASDPLVRAYRDQLAITDAG